MEAVASATVRLGVEEELEVDEVKIRSGYVLRV
jgi:hypothetical protein